MSLLTNMTHTMSVYGKTDTRDAAGGMGRTAVLRDSGLDCQIEDVSTRQEIRNGALALVTIHRLFTLYTGVQNGDTVVYTDPTTSESVTVRVTDINSRRERGMIPAFMIIEGEEIDN